MKFILIFIIGLSVNANIQLLKREVIRLDDDNLIIKMTIAGKEVCAITTFFKAINVDCAYYNSAFELVKKNALRKEIINHRINSE